MSVWSFLTSFTADDWSALGSVLTGVTGVILVVTAYMGLRQWRIQLTGTSKYNIARRLALLGLQFRYEFGQARNAFTFGQEYAERPRREDENPAVAHVSDEYYARMRRLQKPFATLQQMKATSWEAEIILGDEVQSIIAPFEDALQELTLAIETHFRHQQENLSRHEDAPQLPQEEIDAQRELARMVFGSNINDKLANQVNEATLALKTYLQTFLS